jgi:glycosyltransferase involved in cell wall biosynthesis
MKILFVHQNFPGQYKHLAPALARLGHRCVALTINDPGAKIPGVDVAVYKPKRGSTQSIHPFAADFETKVIRGEAAGLAALELKKRGFTPDIIIGHPGWGETLFLRDVFPQARLLLFIEFYYRTVGADMGFDPEFPDTGFASHARLRAKNANNLLALEAMDWGVSPTRFQADTVPELFRNRMSVVHDGIDTKLVRPMPDAFLEVGSEKLRLSAADEVITFVNRNLEPHRGWHSFIRALPLIQRQRPNAITLIVGGDSVSYGRAPQEGSWKEHFLKEVQQDLDLSRIHFLGNIPYRDFLSLLAISSVHVYLTYPFVLSWSLIESMAMECLIVGSDTAPVREVIRHGENGLLVDFFQREAIANTVSQALADRAVLKPLTEQARRDAVAGYDLQTICLPAQLQLVADVAAGRKPTV